MHFLLAFLVYIFFALITLPLYFAILYIAYFVFVLLAALFRSGIRLKPAFKFPFKPAKRGVKYALVWFLFFHAIFCLYRSVDYFIDDRPYKEAKAYAIAGDYMALWQLLFGNYRTVDTSFYQAFQKLQQKFVLDPIYDIIPETDGERYIWRYKFQLYIYARSYWAPVTDEDKRKGIKFHWFFASYKPELLPILLDIYDSIVKLDTLPIQDKEFSEIYRYLTMANMFQYYQMYRERQVNLEYERNQSYSNGRGSIYRFFTTPYYVDQHNRFLKAIDDTKEAIEKNKSLAKAFESKPHAKTALYWAGIDEYRNWVYRTLPATQDPRSLCQSRELKRYAKYYNEYLTWSQHPRSSFAGFSKHRKRQYAIMVESNRDIAYYAAKYLCGEKFGGYSYWERFVLIRTDPKDLRESLRWDMEHMAGVTGKKIIAWEDNLSIEENNLSNKQTPENNLSKEGITDER